MGVTYICVHVYCGNRYMCQEKWREHMREKHEIGNYCELCNEYCLFKDDLEEHIESHVTEIACEEDLEEHTEIECRQCKKIFKSEDEITKHEDDGKECDQCERWLCHGLNITKHKKKEQCDQCGEYLCYGMSIERHKKRKHGTTSEEGKKEEVTENQIEGEMIKKGNDGQECDQWGTWVCDEMDLKRHKKKEHKPTRKKENKEEDKKTHEMEMRCVECKEKFESLDKIIEHINKNECGGWTCCGTYLKKKKENGQGRETEGKNIKDTERE